MSTSAIPKQMLASVLTAPRVVELQRVEVPELGANDVLIRIEAVGVCGSDTHFYEEGRIGDLVANGPVVLGHEAAGEIVKVGSEVAKSRIGTRVSIEPQTPCRRCAYCKRGEYHLCRDIRFYGAYPVDGAFSEYVVIEDDFAYPVPPSMTAEQAALLEPVSVAVHACRKAEITAGSRVLITGAGPIGILNAQVARAFGATEVVVSDPLEHRREFATTHGATSTVNPLVTDFGDFAEHFDAYIDASGNARAINDAIQTVRPSGHVVLVGMGNDRIELPIALIQHHELKVTGTFRYANTWPTAIELVLSGMVEVDPLITGRFGLDQVEEALMMTKTDPRAIKSVVVPKMTNRE